MTIFSKYLRFLPMLAVGGLAACSVIDPPPRPACPDVLVPVDSSEFTRFKDGPGRDLTDVELRGEMQAFQGSCDYDVADRRLNMRLSPTIVMETGPAWSAGTLVKIDYFVAIVDPAERILQKGVFTVEAELPEDTRRGLIQDEEVELNYVMEDIFDAPDHRVYMGFQLSREQVQYNREVGGF